MPIKDNTNYDAINQRIIQATATIEDMAIRKLAICGEECINIARNYHNYTDQTGNLTSSIGYVIVKDGEVIVQSSFEVVKDGKLGSSQGKFYSKELAKYFPQYLTLIVVAGMHYATYVADKGYNVIQSAELLADTIVPNMLKKLGLKI